MSLTPNPSAQTWAAFALEAPELALLLRERLHNEEMGSLC